MVDPLYDTDEHPSIKITLNNINILNNTISYILRKIMPYAY